MSDLIDERISSIVALNAKRDNEAIVEEEARAKVNREKEARKAAAKSWWEDAGERMWLDTITKINKRLAASGIQVRTKDMGENIPLGPAIYRHYVQVLLDEVTQKGNANIVVNAYGKTGFSFLKNHEDVSFEYLDATEDKFAEAIMAIVEGSLK